VPTVLLLLPTETYRAEAFLGAAGRLGYEVITASEQTQALAGAMGDRFLRLDLGKPDRAAEAIVARAERVGIDAIVAVDDGGTLTAALAARRLGLRHASPSAVAATRDKSLLRRLLSASQVPQPRYETVVAGERELAARVMRAIGYPVVVKPSSLSGSRGVIRADNDEQGAAAFDRVASISAAAGEPSTAPLLVESYVAGDEVAVEGLLCDGELEILAIFDKPEPLEGPYFEETIYVTPSRHPPGLLADIKRVTAAGAAAIGLREGPLHGELRLRPTGPVVIELAARTIGGRCATSLLFADGSSLEEVVLASAVGGPAHPSPVAAPGQLHPAQLSPAQSSPAQSSRAEPGSPELSGQGGEAGARRSASSAQQDQERSALSRELASASGVLMIPIPGSGVLRAVHNLEAVRALPGVTGLEVTIRPGQAIRALPEGDRYLGFVFSRGEDPAQVEATLRAAKALLVVEIDGEEERVGTGPAPAGG